MTTNISLGDTPQYIAIASDGDWAYVTNLGDVSVIDTADNTLTSTVTVGDGPLGIAIGKVAKVEYVTPGSSWTLEVESEFCEVQTFQMGGTGTADDYGDTGTWTSGGKALDEIFTGGDDGGSGNYIATTYSKTSKDYSGTGFFDETSFPVTLTKGAQAGC